MPFLVVTSITPLAAREPYIDEAAASFKTVMLSMSSGLRELIVLAVLVCDVGSVFKEIAQSITHKGPDPALALYG